MATEEEKRSAARRFLESMRPKVRKNAYDIALYGAVVICLVGVVIMLWKYFSADKPTGTGVESEVEKLWDNDTSFKVGAGLAYGGLFLALGVAVGKHTQRLRE
jgi:drug/metabolite transporter superfamily protein YnfA